MTPKRRKQNDKATSVEDKAPAEGLFLPPFLLGFVAALLLVLIPTVCGFLWVCEDVHLGAGDEELLCPQVMIRKVPSKKKRRLLKWLGREQELDDEFVIVMPSTVESTCRGIAGVWSAVTAKRLGGSELSTCKPKLAVLEEVESGESSPHTTTRDDEFSTAFTTEFLHLSTEQRRLLKQLGERVEDRIDDWKIRASKVAWDGNGPAWFAEEKSSGEAELERIDGGLLYYSYLRIMKWPENLFSHFPFKLCGNGCNSEVALNHSLEFREKFKPWLVSPSTIQENSVGCIFHHAFSPPYNEDENGSHSLVWIRPGKRVKVDDLYSTRAYVNVLEKAVAASMRNSNGRVGKFNVILDGAQFSWSLMPSLHQLKVFITILQDHFPDRLGIILLTNLGRVGEFLVGIIKPIISEEVRLKIKVLPREPKLRRAMLDTVVGTENVPTWLGGKDSFQFNADRYYSDTTVIPDDESIAYITSMPYHA